MIGTLGLLVALLMATAVRAGPADEATRQLELAEADLASGNFERAAASAASALRLDPGLHAALVTRALALQGLGRTDDAGALLRAYRDLRAGLPLDDRVEPALAEIEAAEQVAEQVVDDAPVATADAAEELPQGPLVLVYGPESDTAALERAYAAARPFLNGQPAATALPLGAALTFPPDGLLVLGAEATDCAGWLPAGTLEGHLAAAEAATVNLEPDAAFPALEAAESHLACGSDGVEPHTATRLLGLRALAHWVGGEPERASALWAELFTLDPARAIDGALDPTAQALQLDARARAAEQPVRAEVAVRLRAGWSASIDGAPAEGPVVSVPAGRRILRLTGPAGETLGGVVQLAGGASVVIGTGDAVAAAVYEPAPPAEVLRWVAAALLEVAEREQAVGALLVSLTKTAPDVRRFDVNGSFVLSLRRGGQARSSGTPGTTPPRLGSLALLGGGLAATAVGVIVAAVAHADGTQLQNDVDSFATYGESYAPYEAARTRERVGAGLAIGGGVVAAFGGVTLVIPSTAKPKAAGEVAGR